MHYNIKYLPKLVHNTQKALNVHDIQAKLYNDEQLAKTQDYCVLWFLPNQPVWLPQVRLS